MFPDRPRVVIDTGVLVSRILRPQSVPAQAVALALTKTVSLVSEESLTELTSVITRPKFAAYIDPKDAREFVEALAAMADIVHVTLTVSACRDPQDDKFLALALSGQADIIITGDDDLLTLHPFRGISILTPRQFLEAFPSNAS